MAATITTAGVTLQTATQLRRALDRGPDGALWALHNSGSTVTLWYSVNNGTTWQAATGTIAGFGTALFVDGDGGINVVYDQAAKFRRGTMSAGTVTWSAAHTLAGVNNFADDLVVFRDPAGTGWQAWTVGRNSEDGAHILENVRISTSNVASQGWIHRLTPEGQVQGGSGFNGTLDFHHTGDGKTVQSGTPHLYLSWNDAFGRNHYRRFMWNGSYHVNDFSSGSITDNGLGSNTPYLAFDGTRIVAAIQETSNQVRLRQRDAGNTATVDHGLSPNFTVEGPVTISYDRDGNVYLLATQPTSFDLFYVKWTRATQVWGAWTLVAAANSPGYARLRVGWASGGFTWPTIEAVHVNSTNLQYSTAAVVNVAPNAPGIAAPADSTPADVNAGLTIDWDFNDPDPGDAQTAFTVRRRIGDTYTYWNGSTWATVESGATKIANAATLLALSSGWASDADSDHHYSVKAWDALSQISPWSTEVRVIPSAKDNASFSAPAAGATVAAPQFTVEWSVASQTRYRIRVVDDIGGAPNLGVVDYDSGIVNSVTARTHSTAFPVNNEARQIELTTWNDEGLQSNTVYRLVNVAYTPPSTATLALSTSAVPGAIRATITNPAGGATKSHNDLFRRIVGDTTNGIRVAAQVALGGVFVDYAVASGVAYQYRATTFATTGATSQSAWTT